MPDLGLNFMWFEDLLAQCLGIPLKLEKQLQLHFLSEKFCGLKDLIIFFCGLL